MGQDFEHLLRKSKHCTFVEQHLSDKSRAEGFSAVHEAIFFNDRTGKRREFLLTGVVVAR
jgi:hypothetical protein